MLCLDRKTLISSTVWENANNQKTNKQHQPTQTTHNPQTKKASFQQGTSGPEVAKPATWRSETGETPKPNNCYPAPLTRSPVPSAHARATIQKVLRCLCEAYAKRKLVKPSTLTYIQYPGSTQYGQRCVRNWTENTKH